MIALYRPNPGLTPAMTLQAALVAGFRVQGVRCEERECTDYHPTEVALVHGWKKTRTANTAWHRTPIIEAQLKAGLQVICCERGMWDRSRQHVLAWDGMHGSAEWGHVSGMPSDRWELTELKLKPWRDSGEHVLVCGQVPWDANVEEYDHAAWLLSTILVIRGLTDRRIVFRPHPKIGARGGSRSYEEVIASLPANSEVSDPRSRPIAADLRGAHCSVSWNSNCGIDSVLAGVPTFAFHPNTMAWDVSLHDLNLVEDPPLIEREQWAFDIAYRQWSTTEIASGHAWEWVGQGMHNGHDSV